MNENYQEEDKDYIVLDQFKPKIPVQSKIGKKRAVLETSLGGTIEKNIPEDVVWVDDTFYIKKTLYGLFISILKEPYGAHFITGGTYEAVEEITRWHLKCLQDGTLHLYTRVVGDGIVDGKL